MTPPVREQLAMADPCHPLAAAEDKYPITAGMFLSGFFHRSTDLVTPACPLDAI
jgi:hypothetical protein